MNDIDARAEARRFVPAIDADGELPYTARRELLARLLQNLATGHSKAMFRGLLGLECARRAFPVWESAFDVREPLSLAESAVEQERAMRLDRVAARRSLGRLKADLDGKFLLGEASFRAVYAGFSCWATAGEVVSPADDGLSSAISELDLSPEDWDACFFASLAVSGGATWDRIGDPEARREFWRWYLEEAVPRAFAEAEGLA